MRIRILHDDGNFIKAVRFGNEDGTFKENDIVSLVPIDTDEINIRRKYFFAMLDFVIETMQYKKFPVNRQFIVDTDPVSVSRKKLYYLVRWEIGFTETGYDTTGCARQEPRTTSGKSLTVPEWDDLIERVRVALGGYGVNFEAFDG